MAIGTPALLTSASSNSAGQTSTTTASVSPTTGAVVVAAIQYDAKSAAETPTIAGNGLSWTLVKAQTGTTTDEQMYVWEGRGTPSAGTIVITMPGVETFTRAIWHVVEVTGVNSGVPFVAANTVGASAVFDSNPQTINYAQTFGSGNAGLSFWMCFVGSGVVTATPRTDWTEIADVGISGSLSLESQYRLSADTAGSVTWSAGGRKIGIILELAVPGPTIDTQPTAQTARLNGETTTTATFACAASGTGTVDLLAEIEDGIASGVYGTLANGSGATWSGLTGTGSGSASTSLVGTFTATTLSGRRIRFKADDDNGTTYSDAVALTVLNGPVTTASSTLTSGAGVGTLTYTSDDALTTNGELLLWTVVAGRTGNTSTFYVVTRPS